MFKKLTSLNIDLEKNMTVLDMNSFYEKYILKKDKILITKSYILKVVSADMTAKVFAALEEVLELLNSLRSAWAEIAPDNQQVAA